jgi:hypothetical protein
MSSNIVNKYADSSTKALRNGYKWNINECLQLQREFELLRLSVPEIAALHGRTVKSIMYKIDAEGFASFNDLYVQTYGPYVSEEDVEHVLQLKPANLESDLESELDDDEGDEEFIPNVLSDSDDDEDYELEDDDDDGSNKHFIYGRLKSMQQQITAILGYLTKGTNTDSLASASL